MSHARATLLAITAGAFILGWSQSSQAQDVASFYTGRQINMFIGSAVGGGYDAYARLVGRHIGKYIPGNPTVVAFNTPGASGNTAVGHLFKQSKDGTAFAQIPPGAITKPVYGTDKSPFDFTQLVYLGSANTEVNLCWVRTDAPVQSFKDLLSKELIIGASGEGDSTRDFAVVENNIIGAKFRLIMRYTGVRDIVLAVDRNEVQGLCGTGVPAMMVQRPSWVDGSGPGKMLVQQNVKGSEKLNAIGVPRTADFAKTEEDRAVLELVYAQQQFGRPFVMPPGAPPERVAAIRQAFLRALADKDLLAEAKKMNLDIEPLSGTDLQAIVGKIYSTPAPILKRAIAALVYNPPK